MKKEYTVIGVYPISNFGGIEVLGINGDAVEWRYNFGEPQETQETAIEYYAINEDGEETEGFYVNGELIEFGNIMRVNI